MNKDIFNEKDEMVRKDKILNECELFAKSLDLKTTSLWLGTGFKFKENKLFGFKVAEIIFSYNFTPGLEFIDLEVFDKEYHEQFKNLFNLLKEKYGMFGRCELKGELFLED